MGAPFSAAIRRNCKFFSVSCGSEWETGGIIIHICTLKYILFCSSYNCRHKNNKYIIFKFKIIIYIIAEHIANQPPGMLLRIRQELFKYAGMYPQKQQPVFTGTTNISIQVPFVNQQCCFLACQNSNPSRSQEMSVFLAVELQTPTCSKSWVWVPMTFYRVLGDSYCYMIRKDIFIAAFWGLFFFSCFSFIFFQSRRSS